MTYALFQECVHNTDYILYDRAILCHFILERVSNKHIKYKTLGKYTGQQKKGYKIKMQLISQ